MLWKGITILIKLDQWKGGSTVYKRKNDISHSIAFPSLFLPSFKKYHSICSGMPWLLFLFFLLAACTRLEQIRWPVDESSRKGRCRKSVLNPCQKGGQSSQARCGRQICVSTNYICEDFQMSFYQALWTKDVVCLNYF